MLEKIKAAIESKRYNITNHADEEKEKDGLALKDIFESTLAGKDIENYPDDFPFPSCLVYGKNTKGEHIHSVWAYDGSKKIAILITVYIPDPARWINFEKRR